MVLGYLLYEAVDLGVNVVKITYNGARGVYYWWYEADYPEVEREKRAIVDFILSFLSIFTQCSFAPTTRPTSQIFTFRTTNIYCYDIF